MSAVMPCEIKNGELANLLTVSDAKLSAMERGKQAMPPELEPKIIRWFAHRGGASLPSGCGVTILVLERHPAETRLNAECCRLSGDIEIGNVVL